ncbi:hypothetical protein [Klebsiella aerogenes]|uniref:hypothetical protein n=1 Tax=Klebsiella aerogenes TaxID=548 RepID=UPI001F3F3989|nr:hypothetical protein [Klebsiella aerogenes]
MSKNKAIPGRFGELPLRAVFFSDGDWLWKCSAFFATEFDLDEMAVLSDIEMSEDDPCILIGFAETEQEVRMLVLATLS